MPERRSGLLLHDAQEVALAEFGVLQTDNQTSAFARARSIRLSTPRIASWCWQRVLAGFLSSRTGRSLQHSVQPPHVRFIDGTTKSTSTSMTTKCRSLEPVAIGAAPPPPLQRAGLVRLFGHPLSPSVIAARLLCGQY